MCLFYFEAVNHRPYAVDFQVIFLGDLALPLGSSDQRRLICSLPIIAHRCLERAEAQFKMRLIPHKIQRLKEKCHGLDPLFERDVSQKNR